MRSLVNSPRSMRSTWIHSMRSPGRSPRDWLFSATQACTQRRQPMHLRMFSA
jgi:hypothetical protein